MVPVEDCHSINRNYLFRNGKSGIEEHTQSHYFESIDNIVFEGKLLSAIKKLNCPQNCLIHQILINFGINPLNKYQDCRTFVDL